MRYTERRPDARLAPYVTGLWVQEAPAACDAPSSPTRILPDGSADLVFEFGDPFVRVEQEGEHGQPRQLLSGPRTRPLVVRATGRTGMVVVRFLPWGAAALFGPLHELVDRGVELAGLIGTARARRLSEELSEEGADRTRVVERLLLERGSEGAPDPRVRAAIESLQRARGARSIEVLARGLGMSRRHLVRLFREAVGVSPKTFARVLRFQNATALRRGGRAWSDVAAACGYADQAHLAREVRSLSGLTPTALDRRLAASKIGRRFNGHAPARARGTLYV